MCPILIQQHSLRACDDADDDDGDDDADADDDAFDADGDGVDGDDDGDGNDDEIDTRRLFTQQHGPRAIVSVVSSVSASVKESKKAFFFSTKRGSLVIVEFLGVLRISHKRSIYMS